MEREHCDFHNMKIEDMPTQMLLHQVNHMHKQYFIQLMQKMELKPGQAGILFVLDHLGEISQRELAEKIGVKPPSVTVALRKMESQGYIRKRPDEKDQRIIRIGITEEGRVCVKQVNKMLKKMEQTLFQNMSQEEILLLRRLILQMRENILSEKDFQFDELHHMHGPNGNPCGKEN